MCRPCGPACRQAGWPRGAAFCLGLKICISSFRAAPGGQVFSPQGLHMRNVKWSCTYCFPTGNQSLWLTNTFRPYTQENLHYHPVASRLLERSFLRWLFGAADPTKLAQCCRDRSFRPTYTISFNVSVQTPGLWLVAAGNFGCVVAFQMVCNLRFFIKAFVAATRPKFLQP